MKKALVVEDESSIQEILEEILKSECGFDEVVVASDGLDGFYAAMKDQYDLICLDHMMPFFKGAELLEALRAKPGPNQHTPMFMISAYIPQISQSAKEMENTFFLEKPLDFPRFVRYVKMSVK